MRRRTCNGTNIKRRDLLSESAVRISRCQIDHNPICNIGALRGVKRVREGDGARVMLNDNYILVFHMNVPPKKFIPYYTFLEHQNCRVAIDLFKL